MLSQPNLPLRKLQSGIGMRFGTQTDVDDGGGLGKRPRYSTLRELKRNY